MKRRDLLRLSAAALAGNSIAPALRAAAGERTAKWAGERPHMIFDSYFLEILAGLLHNPRRTSDSFAVCDFPNGTILKSCVARSGKTYVSVARMLPVRKAGAATSTSSIRAWW